MNARPRSRSRSLGRAGVVSMLAISFSIPVYAEDPATPEQTEAAAKSNYANKQVCRMEPVMGSNIKKKICKTQAQIDAERESAQGSMNELNRSKGGISTESGG